MGAEDPGEMALIAESAVQCDLSDRGVRRKQLPACLFDSQVLQVRSQRLAVNSSKATHKVNRMDSGNLRNLRECHRIAEVSVQERHDLLHPRKVLCFFSNLSLVEHAADGLRIPGLATFDQPERFELSIVLPLTNRVKSARCWLSFTYFGESVYADIPICQ
jgi:hypothetical protein